MIIRVFKEAGIKLINVVRREEQVEMLKNEYGADIVLNSTSEDFDAELYKLAQESNATVALDAVAGEMPGRLLNAMPVDSILISYGQLSEQKIGPVNPVTFIFRNQRIEPFLLPYWLQSKGIFA
jgi:NADPH:quinone reductase